MDVKKTSHLNIMKSSSIMGNSQHKNGIFETKCHWQDWKF